MIRRPPRSTRVRSSAASDVYKRQVEDLRDRVMALQEVDDHFGVVAVLFHPQCKRLCAAEREEGVERTGHRAGTVLQEAECLVEFLIICLLYTSPSPRDRTR